MRNTITIIIGAIVLGLFSVIVYGQDLAQIERGRDLFENETFGGNGRTCATCHRADDNFTVNPKTIAKLAADDVIFVPDNPDFENLGHLRNGLFEENQDGFESQPNFRVSMLVSGTQFVEPDGTLPSNRLAHLGWSGDGVPIGPLPDVIGTANIENGGELIDFATGAVLQHTPFLTGVRSIDDPNSVGRVPTLEEKEDILAFLVQLQIPAPDLFDDDGNSNIRWRNWYVRRGAEAFAQNRCNGCHNDTGGNTADGRNLLVNTGVETSPDSPRLDSRVVFNTQPLNNVLGRERFFHNNQALTLKAAIEFYASNAFNDSPAGLGGDPINLNKLEVFTIEQFLIAVNVQTNLKQFLDPAIGELPLEELYDAFEMTPYWWSEKRTLLFAYVYAYYGDRFGGRFGTLFANRARSLARRVDRQIGR